jgi:hypothetical protein
MAGSLIPQMAFSGPDFNRIPCPGAGAWRPGVGRRRASGEVLFKVNSDGEVDRFVKTEIKPRLAEAGRHESQAPLLFLEDRA